jgi:hypothetical protein
MCSVRRMPSDLVPDQRTPIRGPDVPDSTPLHPEDRTISRARAGGASTAT